MAYMFGGDLDEAKMISMEESSEPYATAAILKLKLKERVELLHYSFTFMLSERQTCDAEHEANISMDHNLQAKKISLQHQTTRLQTGKVVSPVESRRVKLRDESRHLKSQKPIEETGTDHISGRTRKIDSGGLAPSKPSGYYQKPWPSSKELGVEELIKHMSNVPCYLQMERGENVQQKALNFGVIDWGCLEKWANNQKQSLYGRSEDSPSTSETSFPGSTFGSSTKSCATVGSPPVQRKKSSSFNPSVKGCQTKMMGEDKSKRVVGFPDSRTSPISTSIRHHQPSEMECHVGTDYLSHQHGNGKRKDLDMKTIPCNVSQPADTGTSSTTQKDHETSNVAHNMVKVRDSRSREVKKSDSYKQKNHGSSFSSTQDSRQGQYLVLNQNIEGMRDHLQENVNGICSSIEPITFNRRPTGLRRNSFSANFLPEDVQFFNPSRHLPHSCPLPSTDQSDEHEMDSTPLSGIEVPVVECKGKSEKHNQITEKFVATVVDSLGQDEAKACTKTGRELLPDHYSGADPNRMKRSCSLREGSSVGQMKWTAYPDNSHGDKATANNRSRRSPLRRMLDPLLKSKNRSASSIHDTHDHEPCMKEESTSKHGLSKSFGATINSSNSQAKENLNSSSQASASSHDLLQDERHVPSSRQALLQLTWKNDTPFFMLSSNDSNILAATMRKESVSNKDNSECIYTILSVHEVKKKSGVWINQGNNSKKHGLVSNVVGQLKVSSSKLISSNSKDHFVVREFVLLGSELIPASPEPICSIPNRELAAVIVKISKEGPQLTLGDVLKSGNCWDSSQTNSAEDNSSDCQARSLQIELNTKNLSLSSITAIVPSKVHGLPVTGEPSPLIKRWKSGGICDCGGWDEGCTLNVLTDKVQESKSLGEVQAFPTKDGTCRIDLFIQGTTGENRQAFRLVGCKEGLYTIEFSTSIALLQAFAICIAALYSRKHVDPPLLHDSVEAKSFREHIFATNTKRTPATAQGGAPASYVPHHPPLSPVGRA